MLTTATPLLQNSCYCSSDEPPVIEVNQIRSHCAAATLSTIHLEKHSSSLIRCQLSRANWNGKYINSSSKRDWCTYKNAEQAALARFKPIPICLIVQCLTQPMKRCWTLGTWTPVAASQKVSWASYLPKTKQVHILLHFVKQCFKMSSNASKHACFISIYWFSSCISLDSDGEILGSSLVNTVNLLYLRAWQNSYMWVKLGKRS